MNTEGLFLLQSVIIYSSKCQLIASIFIWKDIQMKRNDYWSLYHSMLGLSTQNPVFQRAAEYCRHSDWPLWIYDLQNELWCGLYSSDTDRVIYDLCVCLQLVCGPEGSFDLFFTSSFIPSGWAAERERGGGAEINGQREGVEDKRSRKTRGGHRKKGLVFYLLMYSERQKVHWESSTCI